MAEAKPITRRTFMGAGAAAFAGLGASRTAASQNIPPGAVVEEGLRSHGMPEARADAIVLIWLAGGLSQTDTWDAKRYTRFVPGMKAYKLLGTSPVIETAVDGVRFGSGLEDIAAIMDRGTVVRSLRLPDDIGVRHMFCTRWFLTGYHFANAFSPPSMGSVIARTLGERVEHVPPYFNVGPESSPFGRVFFSDLHEMRGGGFLGNAYDPFVISDPGSAQAAYSRPDRKTFERLSRRQDLLRKLSEHSPEALKQANDVKRYLDSLERSIALLDSSVLRALDVRAEPEAVRRAYDVGSTFGPACLCARRLIESGARFVQVEFPYEEAWTEDRSHNIFDAHSHGARQAALAKSYINRPIARLIIELEERGLLDRTIVVVASEFGRTTIDSLANNLNIAMHTEDQYGFHSHAPFGSLLAFGGGFKRGFAYGKTADANPMLPEEREVSIRDFHATLYWQLGIAPDVYYVADGRPVYVTELGEGRVIHELLA